MPIVILEPPSGAPTGPGFIVHVQSDLIGPIPGDAEWILQLFDSDLVNSACSSITRSDSREISFVLGYDYINSRISVDPASSSITSGKNMQLQVTWSSPTTGIIEQKLQPQVSDMVTGQPYIQTIASQLQGQGGMTTEEHTWLDTVQQAVQHAFADIQGLISMSPIGTALQHPDHNFLIPAGNPFDLVGRGVIVPPSALGAPNSFGIQFQVETLVPGYGLRDGVIVEWEDRMVQLAAFHTIRGTSGTWCTQVDDISLDRGLWLYRVPGPAEVRYDVTPNVVIHCQWISATFV